MGSRLLRCLGDDKPDLHKEIGCMTGMLQLFDPHHLIAATYITHDPIPSGYPHLNNNTVIDSSQRRKAISEMHNRSTLKHEKERAFTESSREASFANQAISPEASPSTMQFQDSLKILQQEKMKKKKKSGPADLRESLRALAKLRESPSSFNESLQFPTSSFEAKLHNNAPRASFDSQISADTTEFAETSGSLKERGKKPVGVVARLMGLEAFPTKDTDFPSKLSLDEQVRSSNFSDRAVEKPSSSLKSLVEESPKLVCVRVEVLSMQSEIESRLKDLRSKQSGKDLRAIKEILEGIRNNHTDQSSPVVIMKPTKLVDKSEVHRISIAAADKKSNGQSNVSLTASSSSLGSESQASERLSPRNLQPKKLTKLQSKQVNELSTSGRKLGHASVNSELRVDATGLVPKTQWFDEDKLYLDETGSATTEHSSPVSVLDISAYTDDSPSPVKSAQKSLKYDCRDYEDKGLALVRNKFQKIENLVEKLKRLNSKHDDERFDYIALLCETSNEDHKYISEILLRSGILLQDLSTLEFHDSYPLNPELFNVLEHKKASQLPDSKLVKQGKMHRKLIFDLVNDILAAKFLDEPLLSKKKKKLVKESLNAQKLLKELCSEIEGLLITRNPNCGNEDEEDGGGYRKILCEQVMKEDNKWKEGESGDLVLEIENLVLKELVDEIVNGEICALRSTRQRRARRLRFAPKCYVN